MTQKAAAEQGWKKERDQVMMAGSVGGMEHVHRGKYPAMVVVEMCHIGC